MYKNEIGDLAKVKTLKRIELGDTYRLIALSLFKMVHILSFLMLT